MRLQFVLIFFQKSGQVQTQTLSLILRLVRHILKWCVLQRMTLLWIVVLFFVDSLSATNLNDCTEILNLEIKQKNHSGRVEKVMVYLRELHAQRILSESEIAHWIQSLRSYDESLYLPFQEQGGVAGLIHRQGISAIVNRLSRAEKDELLRNMDQFIGQLNRLDLERAKIKKETQNHFYGYRWIPVTGRDFVFGEWNKIPADLVHSFEIMDIPVTQGMWLQEMGTNPASFKTDESQMEQKSSNGIEIRPNAPVESITIYSAMVFANRLSLKNGLQPAYNLSYVKFNSNSSPEDGTLIAAEESEFQKVQINAPNGNIYLAEGYRLPTELEIQFLNRREGQSQARYYFGENLSGIHEHEWIGGALCGVGTKEVASFTPLKIDGGSLFDLLGNVQEFCHMWRGDQVIKGSQIEEGFLGSYGYSSMRVPNSPSLLFMRRQSSMEKDADLGFRLVRNKIN